MGSNSHLEGTTMSGVLLAFCIFSTVVYSTSEEKVEGLKPSFDSVKGIGPEFFSNLNSRVKRFGKEKRNKNDIGKNYRKKKLKEKEDKNKRKKNKNKKKKKNKKNREKKLKIKNKKKNKN